MRKLLVIALVLGLVGVAGAYDLGTQSPAKATPVVPQNVPNPNLQGGETVLNATLIPAIPYSDSGTTAGHIDDYDEACPYTGSTSPDVVYKLIPATTQSINVDLCYSSYDTKVYVYNASLALIACNDDAYFGAPCWVYSSKVENVTVTAGQTYYIIIDGYGGDYGAYVMDVTGFEPCILTCPTDGVAEGEPPLVDNYVDHHNGGCNTSPGWPFQEVIANPLGEQILCGVSGWYLSNGSNYRDTDWYHLYMGYSGSIEISIESEQPTYIFELSPQDCNAVGVLQSAQSGVCVPATMTISGYSFGQQVWFWAGPTVYATPPGAENMYDYIVTFSGLQPGTATEATTWSTMKALY